MLLQGHEDGYKACIVEIAEDGAIVVDGVVAVILHHRGLVFFGVAGYVFAASCRANVGKEKPIDAVTRSGDDEEAVLPAKHICLVARGPYLGTLGDTKNALRIDANS